MSPETTGTHPAHHRPTAPAGRGGEAHVPGARGAGGARGPEPRTGGGGRAPGVPDEVLARRASLGDKDAFSALVDRHGASLYRYVHGLLGNAQDAEDCVQEVVLSAWRAFPSFRGDASVRTWFYVLARHQAHKQRAAARPPFPASGSLPALDVHEVAEQVRDTRPGPGEENLEAALLAALAATLRLLPERQRTAWILREVEGLSYSEIGDVLSASPSTVRGLLERARATVASTLEGWR